MAGSSVSREALELFWEVADQSGILAWSMDAEGRYLKASRAKLEFSGLSFEEMTARGESERLWAVHAEERPAFAELISRCVLADEAGDFEPRFMDNAGAYRWMRVRVVPVAFADPAGRSCLATATDIHSARLAADEVRAAEQRAAEANAALDTLLNHAPVGVAFVDPALRFVRANEEVARITGLQPEQFSGQSAANLRSAGGESPFARAAEVIRTGVPIIGAEIEGSRADDPGGTHYWLANYYPIRSPEGVVTGAAAVLTDITSRKLAEAEARRLAAIVESSHDAIVGFGLDGIIQSWNAGAEQLLGWTAAEAIGQSARMFRPPEFADDAARDRIFESLMARLGRGEAVEEFETVDLTKDGRRIPVLFSASPLFDANGTVSGAAAILHDMSAHKEAEDARRESERRYRALLESVPAKLSVSDFGRRWTYWNDAWLTYLGFTAEELLTNTQGDLVHRDDLLGMVTAMLEGIPHRQPWEYEARVRRFDGAYLWHLVRNVPIESPDGEPTWLSTAIDIEAIKQAELTLQETLQAKDEFLEIVSHELRTPLTEILGDADILYRRRGQLAAEVTDELSAGILAAAKRLKRPVDNMTVISRLERGMSLEAEPVLLSRVVALTVVEFRERFPGVDVRLIVEEPQPVASANATGVDQVVFNLLANAATYGAGVDVEVRIRASGDSHVECLVLDRGPGLPPGDLEHVFEPNFRSPVAAGNIPSLGLGLSASRRLIEALGGTMWLQARDGGGLEAGFRVACVNDLAE